MEMKDYFSQHTCLGIIFLLFLIAVILIKTKESRNYNFVLRHKYCNKCGNKLVGYIWDSNFSASTGKPKGYWVRYGCEDSICRVHKDEWTYYLKNQNIAKKYKALFGYDEDED